jgi:P-type Cu+ transporter
LVRAVEGAGYGAFVLNPGRAGADAGSTADADALERRLRVATVLTLPTSALILVPRLRFRGWQWASFAAAVPVVAWAGAPFHARAVRGLRHRSLTMDTLVSLGTIAAMASGAARLLGGREGHHDFEVATGVTAFMLGGRISEARARGEAGQAIRTLLSGGAQEASVLDDDDLESRVPAGELVIGDRFVVRPGEKLAADGVVEDGSSEIDQSLLTGETLPFDVATGSMVAAGTVNVGGGRLIVRVTRVGVDTALARIARLVADAQVGKAPVQRLADRVSAVFVPAVLVLAAGTFVAHRLAGRSVGKSVDPALSVLVAACPCALGLATPAALMVGIGRGAELGMFIRSPEVLEATRGVDTVVFDKTGTLTTGTMRFERVLTDEDEDDLLRLAGAVEDASEHPIGRAVAAAAKERFGALPAVADFRSIPGGGVVGTVDGHVVQVGPPDRLAADGLALPPELGLAVDQARGQGRLVVAAAWDGTVRGLLLLSDVVRPTSREAVGALRELGMRPVMVTGDHDAAARAVAAIVGIDEVHAGVRPEGKVELVSRLQAEGRVVAVIGDGLNDAPALAQADLGIALGTGTDVAMQAADLTLASGDLRIAADAIRLARHTLTAIRQNLAWAMGYNLVALPLAASGRLNPMVGGAAMAASSVIVVSNSLRLRNFRSSVSAAVGVPEGAG